MKKTASIILFCIFALSVNAQELGLNMRVGIPTADFRNATPSLGVGLGATLLFPVKNAPLQVGGEIAYLNHGYKSMDNFGLFTNSETSLTVKNNMLTTNLVARFLLSKDKDAVVTPYLEGAIGLNMLYTVSKWKEREIIGEPDTHWIINWIFNSENEEGEEDEVHVTRQTEIFDTAFVYGGGIGFLIGLENDVKFNIKCRYLYGTEAKYMDKGSVRLSSGYNVEVLDTKKSLTHMIIPEFGAVVLW